MYPCEGSPPPLATRNHPLVFHFFPFPQLAIDLPVLPVVVTSDFGCPAHKCRMQVSEFALLDLLVIGPGRADGTLLLLLLLLFNRRSQGLIYCNKTPDGRAGPTKRPSTSRAVASGPLTMEHLTRTSHLGVFTPTDLFERVHSTELDSRARARFGEVDVQSVGSGGGRRR